MNIKYRRKIAKKIVSVLTILSLLSILIISAIPVSACYFTIGTFEDDYTTSKDSFFKGEIVYGKGQAYGYNYFLKLRIRDPDGNIVYHSDKSQYVVYSSFLLNDSAKTGTWNIQLGIYKCGDWQWSTNSGRIAYFTVCDTNFTLTVNVNGNGLVVKDPDQSYYTYGTNVGISAVADLGWSFNNWTGDINSDTNPESIEMDSDKSITANFVENQYVLTVDVIGNGSVVIDPNFTYYTYGSIINLTAQPNESWYFDHWEGDLSGYENPISIIMDNDKNAIAVFSNSEPICTYTLTINTDGDGVVDVEPSGPYYYGDIVYLTAIPSEGSTFNHWSGNLSGNSNPAEINMTDNKYVTAHFVKSGTNGGNSGNGNGGGGISSLPKKKSNKPPIADLSAGELYVGFVNEEIDFNGTLSYDYDGYIIEWLWDFGNGTTALGELVSHNYSSPGEYVVTLKVTDNKGANDTDETTVVINQPNRPPSELIVIGPTKGLVKIEYLFSIVSTDEDNDKIKYTIDWGDETTSESDYLPSGDFFNKSHKWVKPGEYQINVSAYDNDTTTKTDITITINKNDIPEESNIIIIFIL